MGHAPPSPDEGMLREASEAAQRNVARRLGRPLGGVLFIGGSALAIASAVFLCDMAWFPLWTLVAFFGLAMSAEAAAE